VTEVVLFHHALGLTDGVAHFAETLRAAGHSVLVPDLYCGRVFPTIDAGVAYAKTVGFDAIIDSARAAVADVPRDVVYAGFSLGVVPAQSLAQTRSGARGGLLYHGAVPVSEFGAPWPVGVPLQMHIAEGDELGDLDIAQEMAREILGATLFLYPSDAHLFTDTSLPDYDEAATDIVIGRTLAFLEALR